MKRPNFHLDNGQLDYVAIFGYIHQLEEAFDNALDELSTRVQTCHRCPLYKEQPCNSICLNFKKYRTYWEGRCMDDE